MADIKISFNSLGVEYDILGDTAKYQSHCFLTKYYLILVQSIKNRKLIMRIVELLLLCFHFYTGFAPFFQKCNFKVHLVCNINCSWWKTYHLLVDFKCRKYSAT